MQERIIYSVGIDIGTSTTQLVFSRLLLRNKASDFSVPHFALVKTEILYQSSIARTPLRDRQTINELQIRDFVDAQYRRAGMTKKEIHSGAIIITGETARKENAERMVQTLSQYAGDFVAAAAGPDLEGILAAKGSGAVAYSREQTTPIINFDIGGGTTNLAAFDGDRVLDTACFDIGGRLIQLDPETRKITYLAPKIRTLVQALRLPLDEGMIASPLSVLDPVVTVLVDVLENSVGMGERSPFFDLLITNHAFTKINPEKIETICFSGGVADCLTKNKILDRLRYGDIGPLLGERLRQSLLFRKKHVIPSAETIRATVVGAGIYTVAVTGSTITYTEQALPLRNLPVVDLSASLGEQAGNELARVIQEKLALIQLDVVSPVALSLREIAGLTFTQLQQYARAIVSGAKEILDQHAPLVVLVQTDVAKAFGHSLASILPQNYPLVCVDQIQATDGDYIDLGRPIDGASVLPVTIKTLIFH
ncbi:MAG: ethanolamine ammonia-lyase reactivating factor EutA [Sporolactobacillus sp.]